MNNLYRELAPVSAAAWAGIEQEAKRTFALHAAARKAVDVTGPDGLALAGVGTGHVTAVDPPTDGVTAVLRDWRPVVELRVPFTLSRAEIDSVERGALDADWQPVKDAAKKIAFAEDRAVFDGYAAARIAGVRPSSSNTALALPGEARDYPDVISKAVSQLRLAGVTGPYSLLLSADAWTAVSETSDHGYPVREHLARLLDGDIIWAPAIDGALLLSGRGGDYEFRLGQDLAIGYLSHDAESVQLYFTESFAFAVYTTEASIPLTAQHPLDGLAARRPACPRRGRWTGPA